MRKSEIEELNERVTQRYREQFLNGIIHASPEGFKSLDDWESKPEALKQRISRMLEWGKKVVPFLVEENINWLSEADEGSVTPDSERKNYTKQELALRNIEAAKTQPFLDCVRGWAMREWLHRGRWENIFKSEKRRPILDKIHKTG